MHPVTCCKHNHSRSRRRSDSKYSDLQIIRFSRIIRRLSNPVRNFLDSRENLFENYGDSRENSSNFFCRNDFIRNNALVLCISPSIYSMYRHNGSVYAQLGQVVQRIITGISIDSGMSDCVCKRHHDIYAQLCIL